MLAFICHNSCYELLSRGRKLVSEADTVPVSDEAESACEGAVKPQCWQLAENSDPDHLNFQPLLPTLLHLSCPPLPTSLLRAQYFSSPRKYWKVVHQHEGPYFP